MTCAQHLIHNYPFRRLLDLDLGYPLPLAAIETGES